MRYIAHQMNPSEVARYWAERNRKLDEIVADAGKYKVCDQCRSIAFKRARICGVCGTYRFDETPEYLRETAREARKSPIPFTAGVAPRIRP